VAVRIWLLCKWGRTDLEITWTAAAHSNFTKLLRWPLVTDKYAEHNALVKKLRLRTGPQQAKNFGGEAEVTFGNDNGVIDVQSIMMRPFCYDQLTKKMINSENRKLLHDDYQSHVLFHRKFFVNILAVAFLKVSDVKPIKQLILDIS